MKNITICILAIMFVACSMFAGCAIFGIDHGGIKQSTAAIDATLNPDKSIIYLYINQQGYKEYLNPKDSSILIEIPADSFIMGSNIGYNDEKPEHIVYLDRYYIGKYEVMVAQYYKFCNETGKVLPEQPDWNNWDDHPMVNVSWNDAMAYCKWAGLRLSTEAEWEKAARGTDGRIYPWGDAWDAKKYNGFTDWAMQDSFTETAPVGSFYAGASPYGACNMIGNVGEWCNDWYDSAYYFVSPSINPTGPSSGDNRSRRGSGFMGGCRSSVRFNANPVSINETGGFRVAK
jgi:formylglycine-generating enzyme required for sulfatase activity